MNSLMDTDGENRAVRFFLALYGGSAGLTVGAMKTHMRLCGFDKMWPSWAEPYEASGMHLTKGGAQDWIRYLFKLEEVASLEVDHMEEHIKSNIDVFADKHPNLLVRSIARSLRDCYSVQSQMKQDIQDMCEAVSGAAITTNKGVAAMMISDAVKTMDKWIVE